MAEMKGTTVGILIRIGSGEPLEVAEVDVPIRISLRREESIYFSGRVETSTYVEADWDALNNDIREAIIDVAEEMPMLGPIVEEKIDD